jgi:hypothetical protein
MQNPIHTEPINCGLELNSIRVDVCGIQSTTTNDDACDERQDIDTQILLLAGAARSDQGGDDENCEKGLVHDETTIPWPSQSPLLRRQQRQHSKLAATQRAQA